VSAVCSNTVEASPRLVAGLRSVAKGVWIDTSPVRFLGLHLTANMTVLELRGGGLLLHSPVGLTPERRAAVEALGRVEHLYAPNTFHHLRIGDWQAAFPAARLHAPKGLVKKRKDLRIDRLHGTTAEPAFEGVIEEHLIDGFQLQEAVLLYRPARALVVTDLVHNIGRPTHGWTRLYTKAAGFYDRVAVSRVIKAGMRLKAVRKTLAPVLASDFDTLVVGHGEPVMTGGREALAAIYG
jgi:hypothetical protein